MYVFEITPAGHVAMSGSGSVTELSTKFRSAKVPGNDCPMVGSMMEQSCKADAVDETQYRALIGGVNYYQSVFRFELANVMSVGASAIQSLLFRVWRMLEHGLRYIEIQDVFSP